MNIWIAAYLGMKLLGVGICIAKHGDPKTGSVNAWIALIAFFISMAFLYMAGVLEY